MKKTILDKAKRIKLLAMDVDGVLTGGEIIILDSSEEVKIWSVKDRMGFALLRHSQIGLKLAWITARESKQVETRARDIGVDFLFQKCEDKWKKLEECAQGIGVSPSEIAYIGDDLVDLPVLKRVGLAVCPPESPEILKENCHYQTKTSAGKGVVREVIEILIQAQGEWKKTLARFSLFLIAISCFFSACSPKVPSGPLTEKPDQWIEKFTITETASGVPVWILNSENAQIFNKKRKAILDQIAIQFMNSSTAQKNQSLTEVKKNLTQAARLTAPNGEVNLDTHDLTAWGGVTVRSEDGTTLFTEQLLYSTPQQKIKTESPIKIVRRDSILIGEGLEASPDLSTIKIFRHQAALYPKTVLNK
ncbi:MAG: LPS export ABC transporter periplasmic protein LptC [Elusimicrobia bacterium]|nr:LPS export ABC transporter periplasmic protein LptC [Elusimicrobiota bacterium]